MTTKFKIGYHKSRPLKLVGLVWFNQWEGKVRGGIFKEGRRGKI
jgi:hypothetical protein